MEVHAGQDEFLLGSLPLQVTCRKKCQPLCCPVIPNEKWTWTTEVNYGTTSITVHLAKETILTDGRFAGSWSWSHCFLRWPLKSSCLRHWWRRVRAGLNAIQWVNQMPRRPKTKFELHWDAGIIRSRGANTVAEIIKFGSVCDLSNHAVAFFDLTRCTRKYCCGSSGAMKEIALALSEGTKAFTVLSFVSWYAHKQFQFNWLTDRSNLTGWRPCLEHWQPQHGRLGRTTGLQLVFLVSGLMHRLGFGMWRLNSESIRDIES